MELVQAYQNAGDAPRPSGRGRRTAGLLAIVLVLWLMAALLAASGGVTPPHEWTHHPGSGTGLATESLLGLAELAILAGVVLLLTRRRKDVVPLAERAPSDHRRAAVELGWLAGYCALALVAAAVLPRLFGWEPFSWHLAGTLRGTHHPTSPEAAIAWASFNLVVFAVVPLLWFRSRGGWGALRSTNRRADILVIVTVLLLEAAVQSLVLSPETLRLSGPTLLLGGLLTFLLYLAGAVLPTVVLLHALMLPRVHRLTGSTAATVAVGGVGYAAFHLWDAGAGDTAPLAWAAILTLTYLGPGMFKAWLTVRTGNAWTHAWAYHALAPHVLLDTPLIVAIFGLSSGTTP